MFNQEILTAPKVSESSHGVGYDTFTSRGFIYFIMNYKHGECTSKTSRLYRIWNDMTSRCKYPCHKSYRRYGGRGITVCEEWKDSGKFIFWARENGYSDLLEIDRMDNNGNYEPENCRWSTHQENMTNKDKREDWGIYYNSKTDKYNIYIKRHSITHYGGTTSSIKEARILRNKFISKIQ